MEQPQDSSEDSKAKLRQEYLKLLEAHFSEMPFELDFVKSDKIQERKLRPTAEEYERLSTWESGETLSSADAAKYAEILFDSINNIKLNGSQTGFHWSDRQISSYKQWINETVAKGKEFGISLAIKDTCGMVERDIPMINAHLPCPVFVGEYPTGDFNAFGVRSENGVILLIDRGLFMMISMMAKAYALCLEKRPGQKPQIALSAAGDSLVTPYDSTIPIDDIIDYALDLVVNYSFLRQPAVTRLQGRLGGIQGEAVKWLEKLTWKFVIAHEYAHIIAGHHAQATSIEELYETALYGQAFQYKRWQEFVADEIAARLMFCPDETCVGFSKERTFRRVATIGPAFFFALADLVGIWDEAFGKPSLPDHPPASERWKQVRSQFEKIPDPDPSIFIVADGINNWFRALKNSMTNRLRQQNLAIPDGLHN